MGVCESEGRVVVLILLRRGSAAIPNIVAPAAAAVAATAAVLDNMFVAAVASVAVRIKDVGRDLSPRDTAPPPDAASEYGAQN